MASPSLRSLTFMFFIAILVWCSYTDICHARRGKHWRKNKNPSNSLYKKKAKGHKSNHHHGNAGRYKHKTPLKPPSPPSSPKEKVPPPPQDILPSKVYNVFEFGAKGNGAIDDTKAFQAAWAAACKVEASMIMVPSKYTFLVGPISFSGPYCQANIVFQLEGTIIAPTSVESWGSGRLQWLEFSKLKGITVKGQALLMEEGQFGGKILYMMTLLTMNRSCSYL